MRLPLNLKGDRDNIKHISYASLNVVGSQLFKLSRALVQKTGQTLGINTGR